MIARREAVLVAVGLLAALLGCRQGRGMPDGSTAERIPPDSLARMVETSSAIVGARYEESVGLGAVTLATGEPSGEEIGPPGLVMGLVGTRMRVEDVLKDDGMVRPTKVITYGVFGEIPASPEELAIDAAADFPHIWPDDTEFVLFLSREPGGSTYYLPYGECGRILTGEPTVACSDGDRTVPDFLSGWLRQELLEAIEVEVGRQRGLERRDAWAGTRLRLS